VVLVRGLVADPHRHDDLVVTIDRDFGPGGYMDLGMSLYGLMLAAQAWEEAASAQPLEPALRRRLEAVRALLQPVR
jgi:hypothetical protein